MTTLSHNNPVPLTERLIVDELHYCCPFFFFSYFRSPSMITARLGINKATTSEWRRKLKEEEISCPHREKCMRAHLYLPKSHKTSKLQP